MRSSFNFYKDDFELVFVCYKNDSGLLKLLPVQLSNFALFNGVLYSLLGVPITVSQVSWKGLWQT